MLHFLAFSNLMISHATQKMGGFLQREVCFFFFQEKLETFDALLKLQYQNPS